MLHRALVIMQTKPLAAHVVAALFQLRERTMPITLDTVTEVLGAAPKTDVRAALSALHKEGVVDVTRMRLTLRGLALGSALAGAALPPLATESARATAA